MFCYLTGTKLTSENSSLEHIIPNALGGVLKSKAVLCAEANTKLSLDIDNKFNEIFAGTYRRLPIEKDRQTNRGITGKHVGYNEKVVQKDGKWFPWKPFYDAQKKVVYAQTLKIAEGFIESMKKKGLIPKEEIITPQDDLAGSIEIPFDLDHQRFVRGLAKIAAGFATLKNIKRQDLRMIIDLEKEDILSEIVSFPYVPVDNWEMAFEFESHTSKHYPIHGLSLSSVPEHNVLLCYIELFSTYQYILVLNDDYMGPKVHESYIYSLLESKEISALEYHKTVFTYDQCKLFNAREFKHFNSDQIDEITDIAKIQEQVKAYTFKKFRALEYYVAKLDVANKIAMIDKALDRKLPGKG